MYQKYIAKNSQTGVLSIRTLVRERDTFWNTLYPGLMRMDRKLEALEIDTIILDEPPEGSKGV